jgi:hypothetical protein
VSRLDDLGDRLTETHVRYAQLAVVGFVLFVLVISSPVLGAVDLTPETRDRLGDGTANATLVSEPADGLYVDRGRFGTDVFYLRIPDAVVDVESVTGRPRLVYQVSVPGLDFERSATTRLDGDGRVRVPMDARAFTYAQVDNESYRGTVTVRVQSFETDRVVARRTVTIPVRNTTTWGGR